jgi:hypothetical protein
MKELTLKDAYEILKRNIRYSSGTCPGFVYMSQIEELLQNQKYDMDLVAKVRNREAVIAVDDFSIIKDLINSIYPDDPYLEDDHIGSRREYFTVENIWFNQNGSEYYQKRYWSNHFIGKDEFMETKPRINASQFLLK